uniref:Uncharacterized protein n=1 Tax=Oryza punctata TaxID=4537 RepID=A0A0E0LEN0_ORYPU
MNSWPEDDREPLKAPGYIKMPGRPKTERRREASEPAKPTKASRMGTVITCRKCKQVGHNITSCDKHHEGAGGSSNIEPQGVNNLVLSNTPHSDVQSKKRKAPASATTSVVSFTKTTFTSKHQGDRSQIVRVNAKAKVATQAGGSTTVNLQAVVPQSQGSTTASIQITSDKASVSVLAQEPAKKMRKMAVVGPSKKAKTPGPLLLPRWESDKL